MRVCLFAVDQAQDACVHLHVVDGLHRAMICVRGIGSGRDLEAGVAVVVSAALVAGPACWPSSSSTMLAAIGTTPIHVNVLKGYQ